MRPTRGLRPSSPARPHTRTREPGKVYVTELAAPECVVLGWVGVNGLVGPAVHRKIRLPIAVHVELRYANPALDRGLPDGRSHDFAKPDDVSWKPDVDGNELHEKASARHRQDDSEARLAAHHSLVSLGGAVEREDLVHRAYSCPSGEGHGV